MEAVETVGGAKPSTSRYIRLHDFDTSNYIDLPSLKFEDDGRWRDHAECRNKPEMTPVFFTENARRNRTRDMMVEEARVLCNRCSVRKECFNFAKQNQMRDGVWGGIDFFVSTNAGRKHPIPDSID